MKLTDLRPEFVGAGGDGVRQQSDRPCPACAGSGCDTCHGSGKEYEPAPERHGVGLICDCPCGQCCQQLYVPFANPIDGQGPLPSAGAVSRGWQRVGESFETLTLTPSILRTRQYGGCGWHGWISNGDVTGRVE
jgi:hypothetical protein